MNTSAISGSPGSNDVVANVAGRPAANAALSASRSAAEHRALAGMSIRSAIGAP
jgi:hypothetical protein